MQTRTPLLPLLLSLALSACVSGSPSRAGFSDDVLLRTHVSGGFRSLDHEVYEDHAVIGVGFEARTEESPYSWEFGATLGEEEQDVGPTEHDADFYEGFVGVRARWDRGPGSLAPYVGAGGTYVKVNRELTTGGNTTTAEDWGGGGYVRAGASVELLELGLDGGTPVHLGFDVRAVFAEDVDFVDAAVVLSFGR